MQQEATRKCNTKKRKYEVNLFIRGQERFCIILIIRFQLSYPKVDGIIIVVISTGLQNNFVKTGRFK